MSSVVALRWDKPIHEVEEWGYSEVLRHFKTIRYEFERTKLDAEE